MGRQKIDGETEGQKDRKKEWGDRKRTETEKRKSRERETKGQRERHIERSLVKLALI